jgi:hypothetical protein
MRTCNSTKTGIKKFGSYRVARKLKKVICLKLSSSMRRCFSHECFSPMRELAEQAQDSSSTFCQIR